MAPYTDNAKLLEQINKGKSQPSFRIIPVKNALAQTEPPEGAAGCTNCLTQNFETGVNNIVKAKAAQYAFILEFARNPDIEKDFYGVFEQSLIDAVEKLNEKT